VTERVDARPVKLISATQDSDDQAGIDQNPPHLPVPNSSKVARVGAQVRGGAAQAADDPSFFGQFISAPRQNAPDSFQVPHEQARIQLFPQFGSDCANAQ
jgi:hypothetical protein